MAELGTCPVTLDGIGNGGCMTGPILKYVRALIPALSTHQFDTLTEFQTEATWLADIASQDILPLKLFEETEDASVEELTSDTSAGTRLFHRNGKYGIIGKMLLTPDQNRILQTYNGKNLRFYLLDDDNNLVGTSPDDTVVKGFTASYVRVKPMELPLAADGSAYAVVEVQFEYVEEFNESARYAIGEELTWIPKIVIQPLTKITLTLSTVASFIFTCAFAYVDPTTGKSIPLTSLDANGAELTVIDQGGSAETVTVVATATEGTYTITGSDITSGTITLNASATSLYYSDTTTLTAA